MCGKGRASRPPWRVGPFARCAPEAGSGGCSQRWTFQVPSHVGEHCGCWGGVNSANGPVQMALRGLAWRVGVGSG
eukprot:6603065-Alexandrium_andersonii.AAC.1